MCPRAFSPLNLLPVVATILSLCSAPAAGQGSPERTAWGTPDLSGIWDFRTMIPLERPNIFEGKEFLTEEEAVEFEQQTIQARNNDNRSINWNFFLFQF